MASSRTSSVGKKTTEFVFFTCSSAPCQRGLTDYYLPNSDSNCLELRKEEPGRLEACLTCTIYLSIYSTGREAGRQGKIHAALAPGSTHGREALPARHVALAHHQLTCAIFITSESDSAGFSSSVQMCFVNGVSQQARGVHEIVISAGNELEDCMM